MDVGKTIFSLLVVFSSFDEIIFLFDDGGGEVVENGVNHIVEVTVIIFSESDLDVGIKTRDEFSMTKISDFSPVAESADNSIFVATNLLLGDGAATSEVLA